MGDTCQPRWGGSGPQEQRGEHWEPGGDGGEAGHEGPGQVTHCSLFL